jgi:ornithine cyclodeaminase
MLILKAEDVRQAFPMREGIVAMKHAYAAVSAGTADVPLRTSLSVPAHRGVSLFMPAYVSTASSEALAVKAVSLFPANPSAGLAYIQAAVLLFDPQTGRALALLEGSSLTAIRTGAASGAGIELLSRAESRVAAIFGAGVQGRTQLEAACTARSISSVLVYDPSPDRARAFADEMRGRSGAPADIRVAVSPRDALAEADIVCTATTSMHPVFEDADLQPGTHISAIGAYTPEMREIPAETVVRARVVVDSRSAALAEAGDLIQPIRSRLIDESHIHAELGEIVLGRRPGRDSPDQITLFKSVGIAAQDAVAAEHAYRNAVRLGLGQEVSF